PAAVDPTPNEDRRVDAVAPIGAEVEHRVGRRLELLDAPILEDARLREPEIAALPYVSPLVRVGPLGVLHVDPEVLRKPWVIPPIRLDDDGLRMRRRPAKESVDRVGRLRRVP